MTTSVDKFAEYPYYTCVTQDNNNYGLGKGHWYDKSGKGIIDNKDGSGFARGYSPYADNSPYHFLFDKIKR